MKTRLLDQTRDHEKCARDRSSPLDLIDALLKIPIYRFRLAVDKSYIFINVRHSVRAIWISPDVAFRKLPVLSLDDDWASEIDFSLL